MNSLKEELKPCPFCGSKKLLVSEAIKMMKPAFIVECKKCYASTDGGYTREKAIQNWNTRSHASSLTGEEEEAAINEAVNTITQFVDDNLSDPSTLKVRNDMKEIRKQIIDRVSLLRAFALSRSVKAEVKEGLVERKCKYCGTVFRRCSCDE